MFARFPVLSLHQTFMTLGQFATLFGLKHCKKFSVIVPCHAILVLVPDITGEVNKGHNEHNNAHIFESKKYELHIFAFFGVHGQKIKHLSKYMFLVISAAT